MFEHESLQVVALQMFFVKDNFEWKMMNWKKTVHSNTQPWVGNISRLKTFEDWVSLYKYDSNPVGIYMDQYLYKNTEQS